MYAGGSSPSVAVRVLLIIAVVGSSLAACGGSARSDIAPHGSVSFQDSSVGREGVINAATITVEHLPPPPEGAGYTCWLVDKERDTALRLGRLVPAGDGSRDAWSLQFQGKESDPNLLFSGDKRQFEVLVTEEPIESDASRPTGPTRLLGQAPDIPFLHVQHLLVGHPVTNPPGHLIRLLRQAQILVEEPVAQLFLAIDGVYPQWEAACAAQSILDMVEGSGGPDYHQLAARCTNAHFPITQSGDGYGILRHIQDVQAHVVTAEASAGITSEMRAGADDLKRDATDLHDWYTVVSQYAVEIVNGTNTHARDLRALCENGLQGNVDTGQGGIYQAYKAAQRMAVITLSQPQ
jgi:hypothetical protein